MKDTTSLREKVFSRFPLFGKAANDVQTELFEHAALVQIPAHQFICLEGNRCSGIPLVLEGRARVYKLSESGREITLYRVEPGDSCILTASCIMSEADIVKTQIFVDGVLVCTTDETTRFWYSSIVFGDHRRGNTNSTPSRLTLTGWQENRR